MSAVSKTGGGVPRPTYRMPSEGPLPNAWKLTAAIGGLGAAACVVGGSSDPTRFAFSWLFAFMAVLAIGLGSLFLVIVQQLTNSWWGVTIRRTSEFFMAGLPVFALLFVPVAMSMDELYPWMHHWREVHEHGAEHATEDSMIGASIASAQDHAGAGEAEHGGAGHGGHTAGSAHHSPQHAAHEAVIVSKLGYLDRDFFWLRAGIYFAVWTLLSMFYFRHSTKQDVTRSLEHTKVMNRWAPLSMIGFALSLTFAAFDWMMSLEPAWFSTIYGVQYFSVSVVSSLATLVVVLNLLRNAGATGELVKVDHFHDVGKLMFGFNVFWAYISFSQFMLIWYASIPEETTYYHMRWEGGWKAFSLALFVIHFLIPFFLLISRNVKRRVPVLAFGAAWLLVAHVAEVFWLVMPYVSPGELTIHWLDGAALFAVAGIYLTVVLFLMGRHSLVPVGDPRLVRSAHLETA